MVWRENPLLRFLLVLAPGIGCGLHGVDVPHLLPLLLAGLGGLAFWHFRGVPFGSRSAFALGLYAWFFLFGISV